MIVELINEFLFFMAYPAPAQGLFGDARTHFLEERKRPVQGIVMTILTARVVFSKFLFFAFVIELTVYAFAYKFFNVLM
jgi:hypothetical protein